jgi:glucose-6-phosphate isomerase
MTTALRPSPVLGCPASSLRSDGRGFDVREAFARDAESLQPLSGYRAPEVFADLSKNRIDTATLDLLLKLAA